MFQRSTILHFKYLQKSLRYCEAPLQLKSAAVTAKHDHTFLLKYIFLGSLLHHVITEEVESIFKSKPQYLPVNHMLPPARPAVETAAAQSPAGRPPVNSE